MQTIEDLFTRYDYISINDTTMRTKLFFVKDVTKILDVYSIELTLDNTFNISIPINNSNYLYTTTISNLEDVLPYLELHLQNVSLVHI